MGRVRRLQKRDRNPESAKKTPEPKEDVYPRRTTRIFRKWDAPLQPDSKYDTQKRAEKGHSLLETMCVVGILALVTLALLTLFSTSNSLFRAGNVSADVEEQGRIALMNIADEIKEAGFFTDPDSGESYPYIFPEGQPESPFWEYYHTPAQHQAEPGTPAYGPTREIVFRMAEDLDGDGYKTASDTGEIEWGPDEIAYVLVTGPDGVNQVERRVNNGPGQIIARYVERLCFDDINTDATVPYGQIKVTLHMRKTTSDGRVVKASYSTLVRMRNYEE